MTPGGIGWPNTCDPYYEPHRRLIQAWLNGQHPDWGHNMRIPRLPRWEYRRVESGVMDEMAVDLLTRWRAVGRAPYVGDPFVYTWWVGVDSEGRCVAGDTEIAHVPREKQDRGFSELVGLQNLPRVGGSP